MQNRRIVDIQSFGRRLENLAKFLLEKNFFLKHNLLTSSK